MKRVVKNHIQRPHDDSMHTKDNGFAYVSIFNIHIHTCVKSVFLKSNTFPNMLTIHGKRQYRLKVILFLKH